jgi:hypothetical protein
MYNLQDEEPNWSDKEFSNRAVQLRPSVIEIGPCLIFNF